MGGDGERRTVRLGNTWLMLPYAGVIVAVAVTFDWMSVAALTDRRATAPTGALALLVLTAATLTCVVVAMAAFAVRLPGFFLRTVTLTPDEVRLPSWRGRLRVADIAGVGLALQQRTPGRGGMWGLAVWTVDGRRVWSGGIQRKAQLAAPHTTTIAAAAVAVYQHVLDRQGPNGPLATQALQRHQPVTPYTHWTGYWDPSGANDARVAQDLGR